MKRTRRFALARGYVADFTAGLFGVSGEAASMFLSALDMHKEIFVATGGAFTFIIDALRVSSIQDRMHKARTCSVE